ncbi:MAG: hypothetical protein RLW62_09910, partial [Gammaproteobacteria bacterium]
AEHLLKGNPPHPLPALTRVRPLTDDRVAGASAAAAEEVSALHESHSTARTQPFDASPLRRRVPADRR